MKKSLANVLTLLIASAGGAAFAFLTQVILARQLEPSQYGLFAATLAIVMLVSSLATLGVPGFIVRVFGAEGSSGSRWLKQSFKLVAYGVGASLLVLVIWGGLGPHDRQAFWLLFLLLPVVVSQSFIELVTVKLQLQERFNVLATWQLFPNLIRLAGLGFIIVLLDVSGSITNFGLVYTITACLISIIGFVSMRSFLVDGIKLNYQPATQPVFVDGDTSFATIIRYSSPFALSGIFYIVYFQSDVILLNYLSSSEVAGFYNVAFTVMVAIYLLPNIVYQKFLLPKLYRWVHHDHQQLFRIYRKGSVLMGVTGIAVMVAMYALVPVVIPWLFGEAYIETIAILNILLLCIPVRFISSSMAAALVSVENLKRKVSAMGYTALVNVLLNLALIPFWHAYGAALATLISELLLLGLFYRTVQKHMPEIKDSAVTA